MIGLALCVGHTQLQATVSSVPLSLSPIKKISVLLTGCAIGVVNALAVLVNVIGCCSQCDLICTMQATVSSVPLSLSPMKKISVILTGCAIGVVYALAVLVNVIGCCSQCDWTWTMLESHTASAYRQLCAPIIVSNKKEFRTGCALCLCETVHIGLVNGLAVLVNVIGCCSQWFWVYTMLE